MSMPEYSDSANEALDIFYVGINEVNIYFEDADQENLYEQIVKKTVRNKKIARIFTLGGSSACLSHKSDPANEQIKNRFYVLDKDFTDILGTQDQDDNVIYLDRFCIENYLMETTAIIEFVVECLPKEKATEIKSKLEIDSYIEEISDCARDIFKKFLLCQVKGLPVKNTSLSAENFATHDKGWYFCEDLISNYDGKITTALQQMGFSADIVENLSDKIFDDFDRSSFHSVTSGKFIMSLIFHRIKLKYTIGSVNFYSFLYRVAKNCEMVSLEERFEKISAA